MTLVKNIKRRQSRSIGKGGLKRTRVFGAHVVKKATHQGESVEYKPQDVEEIDGDAKWEQLLAQPASTVLLAAMVQDAVNEFESGETEEGGFGNPEDED